MAKIQQLLSGKDDKIDYDEILKKYPWISKRKQKCILSPDSDGLLCGLFMSHYLDWEIVGFYDGKICVLKEGISAYDDDVCFLDMEIYREEIKSFGHHMLMVYKNHLPEDWNNKLKDCIQPNLMRGYDKNSFRLKYPLATIHLLIAILENSDDIEIEIEPSAIFPLLFTDGTFNVMFSYPENVMNWWEFLKIKEGENLLKNIFLGDDYTVYKLMQEMDTFFRERDIISAPRERGDRLKISNKDGSPYNIEKEGDLFKLNNDAKLRCEMFLLLLSKHTKWEYKPENWNFEKLQLMQFTKSDYKSRSWTIKIENWKNFLELNPLSWAMTSGDNIEFTLEYPDKLL